MSKIIMFNGSQLFEEGSYGAHDDSQMQVPFIANGIVGVVGSSSAGLPYTQGLNLFSDIDRVPASVISGPAYDAIRFAFAPSKNPEIGGAAQVVFSRVDPATDGAGSLSSTTGAIMTLATREYSLRINGTQYKMAAGTQGGFGVAFSHIFQGTTVTWDDLGTQPAFLVMYTGSAATATMAITSTGAATTTAGAVADHAADFATYDTVQKLVDYINTWTNYTAVAVTPEASTFLCSDLDYVAAADLKQTSTTVADSTLSATATTLNVVSGAVCAIGDVIAVQQTVGGVAYTEYMYVSGVATNALTVIRGFCYSDAVSVFTSSATVKVLYGETLVNKSVLDTINNSDDIFTATRNTVAGRLTLPSTYTYVTGGATGTASNTDWLGALNALKEQHVNWVIVASDSATVHGYLQDHCDYAWTPAGTLYGERQGVCGCAINESLQTQLNRAKALNDRNVTLIGSQEVMAKNDQGALTWYPPYILAAMYAGMSAGLPGGTPIVWKDFAAYGLRNVTGWSPTDEDDYRDLFMGGVQLAFSKDGLQVWHRGVTTYLGSTSNRYRYCPSNRYAGALTAYYTRKYVQDFFVGKRYRPASEASVRNCVKAALEHCRDVEGWIIAGSTKNEVTGAITQVPAFTILSVKITSNIASVKYSCTPNDGTEIMTFEQQVGPVQMAA